MVQLVLPWYGSLQSIIIILIDCEAPQTKKPFIMNYCQQRSMCRSRPFSVTSGYSFYQNNEMVRFSIQTDGYEKLIYNKFKLQTLQYQCRTTAVCCYVHKHVIEAIEGFSKFYVNKENLEKPSRASITCFWT